MPQCPKCESEAVHRSRTKTLWEGLRKQLTTKRLFRCRACGWRGWGDDFGPRFNSAEVEGFRVRGKRRDTD